MHVQKAVEESKWCPGNPSFQMLPSAFKLYVKWDLKRKRKRKHSLFLKHRTEFRRSRLRLQLCGSAFYLSFGRLLDQRVGKLPSCSFVRKAGCVETAITVYWSQQERCFWFERVYALTMCLILKNPVVGHLPRRFQVKFSSVWLRPKIWTCFGCSTWMKEALAVLDSGNIGVPLPSQRILVLLCCSIEGFEVSDSFIAGKIIFMLRFVNCLTSQSFYTQSVKWKEKDYFVLFSQSLPVFGLLSFLG